MNNKTLLVSWITASLGGIWGTYVGYDAGYGYQLGTFQINQLEIFAYGVLAAIIFSAVVASVYKGVVDKQCPKPLSTLFIVFSLMVLVSYYVGVTLGQNTGKGDAFFMEYTGPSGSDIVMVIIFSLVIAIGAIYLGRLASNDTSALAGVKKKT
ncbi:hypothetical protein [Thermococcus thioreducens]|uniref:Uncharacterized protein n=1 Tax=Thermococcus thioreducens TaxID=277988 RepID=A0A0Q2S2I0_9EURY|nr:hypothetical protein [Thermococcus thioreducens]ASJ11882.1 hypothetical protein A3L14_02820 [Thermococcus thioreducens]KQH81707.1 hypothetical protein AMR53_09950 [Thermococcus thioreducens]SEW12087.1 hypothetical protein SAMN05216170_1715 [Thermococcus thioreducens]